MKSSTRLCIYAQLVSQKDKIVVRSILTLIFISIYLSGYSLLQ